jgi:hypothetical protein
MADLSAVQDGTVSVWHKVSCGLAQAARRVGWARFLVIGLIATSCRTGLPGRDDGVKRTYRLRHDLIAAAYRTSLLGRDKVANWTCLCDVTQSLRRIERACSDGQGGGGSADSRTGLPWSVAIG